MNISIYKIGLKQLLKTQVSYIKKCFSAHGSLQPSHTSFSLPVCTYGLMRSSLWSIGQGRGNSGLLYRWFCVICRHYQKVDRCSTILPFWDTCLFWRRVMKKNSRRTLSRATGCSFFLEGQMATCAIIYWFMAVGNGLAGASGTRKEHDWENWRQGSLEKRYVDRPFWMSEKVRILVFYVNAHQKET